MECVKVYEDLEALGRQLNVPILRHLFRRFSVSDKVYASVAGHFHLTDFESADFRSAYHIFCDWFYGWNVSDAVRSAASAAGTGAGGGGGGRGSTSSGSSAVGHRDGANSKGSNNGKDPRPNASRGQGRSETPGGGESAGNGGMTGSDTALQDQLILDDMNDFSIQRVSREISMDEEHERMEALKILKAFVSIFHSNRRLLKKYHLELDEKVEKPVAVQTNNLNMNAAGNNGGTALGSGASLEPVGTATGHNTMASATGPATGLAASATNIGGVLGTNGSSTNKINSNSLNNSNIKGLGGTASTTAVGNGLAPQNATPAGKDGTVAGNPNDAVAAAAAAGSSLSSHDSLGGQQQQAQEQQQVQMQMQQMHSQSQQRLMPTGSSSSVDEGTRARVLAGFGHQQGVGGFAGRKGHGYAGSMLPPHMLHMGHGQTSSFPRPGRIPFSISEKASGYDSSQSSFGGDAASENGGGHGGMAGVGGSSGDDAYYGSSEMEDGLGGRQRRGMMSGGEDGGSANGFGLFNGPAAGSAATGGTASGLGIGYDGNGGGPQSHRFGHTLSQISSLYSVIDHCTDYTLLCLSNCFMVLALSELLMDLDEYVRFVAFVQEIATEFINNPLRAFWDIINEDLALDPSSVEEEKSANGDGYDWTGANQAASLMGEEANGAAGESGDGNNPNSNSGAAGNTGIEDDDDNNNIKRAFNSKDKEKKAGAEHENMGDFLLQPPSIFMNDLGDSHTFKPVLNYIFHRSGSKQRARIKRLHQKFVLLHQLLSALDIHIFPKSVRAHREGVKSLQYSQFNSTIWMSGGYDCVIRIHDLNSKTNAMVVGGANAAQVAANGNTGAPSGSGNTNANMMANSNTNSSGNGNGGNSNSSSSNVTGALAQYIGHRSIVTSAVFTKNNGTIVSGSFDRTVKVWNSQSATCERTLVGHEEAVTCVTISPDQRYVASSSTDKTVRIWELASGECVAVIHRHTRWVKAVRFSHDGRYLFTAGLDKIVYMWDVRVVLQSFGRSNRLARANNNNNNNSNNSNNNNNNNSNNGNNIANNATNSSNNNGGNNASSHPSTPNQRGSEDGSMAAPGGQLQPRPPAGAPAHPGGGRNSIRPGPGSAAIGSSSNGGGSSGNIHSIGSSSTNSNNGGNGNVNNAAATNTLFQVLENTFSYVRMFEAHEDYILDMAIARPSMLLTCSRDQTVKGWDYLSGKLLYTVQLSPSWACSLAFSHDGELFATASFDNNVVVCRSATGEKIRHIRVFNMGILSVAFPDNYDYLVVGTSEGCIQQIPL